MLYIYIHIKMVKFSVLTFYIVLFYILFVKIEVLLKSLPKETDNVFKIKFDLSHFIFTLKVTV